MRSVSFALIALTMGSLTAFDETAADPSPIAETYRGVVEQLIAAALSDQHSTARLEYLCDRIGNRLSGSASLERAIEWSAQEMTKAGLTNVQTPPVKVPHWVRGNESATLLSPITRRLDIIGLGMSVGTPRDGITAEVVPAENLDKLAALGSEHVAGKIVLFTADADEKTYRTPGYRQAVTVGPSRAAALGAVGVLVKSGYVLQSPRTTGLDPYAEGVPKIPAAAIKVEDALMMQRQLASRTQVRVHLVMDDHQEPDADSHNVMGELRGRDKVDEVVVLGGHIDSWDVGQGANDDGSGMMAVLEAVLLIKKLGLQPRRTIRLVFWVNEENGGAGGRAYRAMIGADVKNHIAAIEMDNGAEKPVGFNFGAAGQDKRTPRAYDRVVEIGALLKGIAGGKIIPGGGSGGDIRSLVADGVPGFAVKTVETLYPNWHHTPADTFDKIVLREFQLNVASLAAMAYVLADMPDRLSDLD
jgi:Zn-dependent M28 family amino/carboxypeptidase